MVTGIFAYTARYYIHDHLYNPVALTDYSGNVGLPSFASEKATHLYVADKAHAQITVHGFWIGEWLEEDPDL